MPVCEIGSNHLVSIYNAENTCAMMRLIRFFVGKANCWLRRVSIDKGPRFVCTNQLGSQRFIVSLSVCLGNGNAIKCLTYCYISGEFFVLKG